MRPEDFTVSLTAQDCAAAATLLAQRHPLRRLGPWVVIAVSLVIGGVIALASAKLGSGMEARRAFGLGAALCALFLGLQYLMLLKIAVQTTRRSIESTGWCDRAVSCRIDEAGLTLGGETLQLAWSEMRTVAESADLFVVTSSAQPPVVLPKRFLPPKALAALRRAQVHA